MSCEIWEKTLKKKKKKVLQNAKLSSTAFCGSLLHFPECPFHSVRTSGCRKIIIIIITKAQFCSFLAFSQFSALFLHHGERVALLPGVCWRKAIFLHRHLGQRAPSSFGPKQIGHKENLPGRRRGNCLKVCSWSEKNKDFLLSVLA